MNATLGQNLLVILPEIGLAVLAVIVLALDLTWKDERRSQISVVAGAGLGLLALVAIFVTPNPDTLPAGAYWGGMIHYDVLSQIFKVMILAAAALTSLMSVGVRGVGLKGEFYLILIISTLGMTLMSCSGDLVMAFLALETTSIPLYILATFKRGDSKSVESGVKYFLFGSFASALLLYGMSLLYGFTGQTNLYQLAGHLTSETFANNPVPTLVAMVLVIVGFGFKISAVPFHFWTPDVYEGAPTPVTAFLSVASKAASFALLVRFLLAVFPAGMVIGSQDIQSFWITLMTAFAAISMTIGNVLALVQHNIKRMLAYSSIAQAGYTLIGVAALKATSADIQSAAVASIAFYMFMYVFTNLLAFVVIILVSEATGTDNISGLAGLSKRSPWLALMMTVALLSLGGVPPMAGFFGKFFLFNAAVQADLTWLALVGVLNAIVALYYYLVVVKVMYVDKGTHEDQAIPISSAYTWVMAITCMAVVIIGTVGAQPLYDWAVRSAGGLFS